MPQSEPTVEDLRRKAAAAKSLLSRYHNERESYLRQTGSTLEDYNQLVERERQQERLFQQAVRAWKAPCGCRIEIRSAEETQRYMSVFSQTNAGDD